MPKPFSSLHVDCLTKWVRQFRLGIAINRRFECSVFRGPVFRWGRTIRGDSAGRFSSSKVILNRLSTIHIEAVTRNVSEC